MASAAAAPALEKKRTTVTLPSHLLEEMEQLADKRNTTVSAIIAQAAEAGLGSMLRKERAQQAYTQLRDTLADLTEEERMLVDGIRLTPLGDE